MARIRASAELFRTVNELPRGKQLEEMFLNSPLIKLWMLVLGLTLVVSSSAIGQLPKEVILSKASERSCYFNHRFVYKFVRVEDGLRHESRRELLVAAPMKGSSTIPFRLSEWIANPGDPLTTAPEILSFWEGFDGKETRRFSRKPLHDVEGSPRFSEACIIGQPGPFVAISSDPFCQSILMGPDGMTILTGKSVVTDFTDWTLEVVEHANSRKSFRVRSPFMATDAYWEMLDLPEAVIVRRGSSDGTSNFLDTVDSFRDFEGLRIPETGRSSMTYRGHSRVSSFALQEVGPCPVSVRNWFPKWGSGTNITDYPQDKVSSIPYTPEEIQLIRKRMTGNELRKSRGVSYVSAVLILNLLLMTLFFGWWFRKRKKSQT